MGASVGLGLGISRFSGLGMRYMHSDGVSEGMLSGGINRVDLDSSYQLMITSPLPPFCVFHSLHAFVRSSFILFTAAVSILINLGPNPMSQETKDCIRENSNHVLKRAVLIVARVAHKHAYFIDAH